MNMAVTVTRTFTRVDKPEGELTPRRSLELFRNQAAYVLLGDPGSGKTFTFIAEAKASGAEYIVARDFLTFEPRPEWKDTVLFIDGLDEVRSGGVDGKTPLDRIREKLDKLGRPRFRLSCREADWLGASDRNALERVSADGEVAVLHLELLTRDQVLEILQERVANPERFVEAAIDRGLEGMLYNPQTLQLVIDAVKDGKWPDTREDTFEMACSALAQEPNIEHRTTKNNRDPNSPEKLLDAAGYLCSVQLLTGSIGFAIDASVSRDSFVKISDLAKNTDLPLRETLKTKLFKGEGRECFMPIHRSVAEYISARYLGSRFESEGLPLGRILALMLGVDGGVVADLRGLHSWLATHYKSERPSLIVNDPLGVVLYGDVSRFSLEDKRLILDELNRLAKNYPWFRWSDWRSPPFGALSTPDMAPVFEEILKSSSRSDADQALAECVLDALHHGTHLSQLDNLLLEIVRDSSRATRVRKTALQTLFLDAARNLPQLLELLDDIRYERVEDRDDELFGQLLEELYPNSISIDRIFDYLRVPRDLDLLGSYVDFWSRQLPKSTPDKDLPKLLDELAKKDLDLSDARTEYHISLMVGTLLAKGIELFGETIPTSRLYTWLGIGLDRYRHRSTRDKHGNKIKEWLSSHPEQYKSLIAYAVSECGSEEELERAAYRYDSRLFFAESPKDLGIWYLSQSDLASDEEISFFYFRQAVFSLFGQRTHAGLSLELFEEIATKSSKHRQWLEPLLYCTISDYHLDHIEENRKYRSERRSRKNKWIDEFRKHVASIRDGSAPPSVFNDLGAAYFGHYYEASGENPLERLNDFFDGDQELVNIALTGFREVLSRNDLPTTTEIFDLDAKGRTYYIRLACLAGIAEWYRSDPERVVELNESLLSKILAFHFTYGVGGSDPEWYSAFVKARPDVVADVLISYASRAFQAGKEHISGIYSLAHDDSFGDVARRAIPRLLIGFPIKIKKGKLSSLEYLLKGAIRHVRNNELISIIDKKLSNRNFDVGQRVYWLASGLILASEKYEAKLRKYVGTMQLRARYLGSFLSGRNEKWAADRDLPASSLGVLIELLGPGCVPDRPVGARWVTESMEVANLVRSYINRLGSSPAEEASTVLETLLKKQGLKLWHNSIKRARESQRVSRREATFLRPTLGAVVKTLANLQPANPADLAALAYDHLRQIGQQFRFDNTDPYKLFWNEDHNGNPVTPKSENSCRDVILKVLRERLAKIGVDAQPEGEYANNKRTDIRVSFGGGNGFNVPIEIKRATHDDLWRAMHDQLIAKYTKDIGAEGYGIYLVLWFGNVVSPPSGGRKPSDSLELERRLVELLDASERNRIKVLVIDCAPR